MSAPDPIDMVHELHNAIYGYSTAQPDPPAVVWARLLDDVRWMAAGKWLPTRRPEPSQTTRVSE